MEPFLHRVLILCLYWQDILLEFLNLLKISPLDFWEVKEIQRKQFVLYVGILLYACISYRQLIIPG